jgi:predicted double-glycine peptidase
VNPAQILRNAGIAGSILLASLAGAALPAASASAGEATGLHALLASAPVSSQLGPLINIPQTWNNCGPSSVAEVLAFWGISRTQWQVQSVLRADGNAHGMSPYGVPAYARSLGLRAQMGIAGSERLVKLLVANGFPVIVSQYVSLADHVGHYRPIQAYDDRTQTFVSSDPYLGQGHVISYAEFDAIWKSTNRRFMVLYPPGKQALLDRVLTAGGWSAAAAYRADLARVQSQIAGRTADTTGYGSPRNYTLSIAWDDLELGRIAAARAALAQAAKAGASPVVAAWIAAEIARGASVS